MLRMTSREALAWFLLTLLACLGNYFALPLLFGVDLLLGSIFLYLILFYLGLSRALLSALPAYLLTWLLWGHPWAGVTYFAELLLVGALLKHFKFRELILFVAGYWVLIGTPASLLIYSQLLALPWLDVWMLVGKKSLNSLASATLALALIYLLPTKLYLSRKHPQLSITDLFFYLPTLMLVLGGLVVVMVTGHYQMARAEQEIQRQLTVTRGFVARQLEERLNQLHEQLLQISTECQSSALSQLVTSNHCYDRQLMNRPFEQFLLRPMSEKDWILLNSHIARNGLSDEQRDLLQVSLQELKGEGKNRTEAMTSRGELLLVRRVFNESGQQDWLAGLVSLNYFRINLMSGGSHPDLRYIWQLGDRALLVSQDSDSQPLPVELAGDPENHGRFLHWLPDEGKNTIARWSRSIYYIQQPLQQLGINLPGVLRVEVTPRLTQKNLFQLYSLLFTLAFAMIFLGLLISRAVAAWVARPVHELVRVADAIPNQLELPLQSWSWPETHRILEFEQLKEHLMNMGYLLKEQFSELQAREQQLEEAVNKRTRELVDAHQHLQSVMDSMEAVLWSAELSSIQGKNHFTLSFISPSVLHLTGYSARTWLTNPGRVLRSGLDKKQVGRVLAELQNMAQRGRGRIVLSFKNPKEDSWRVLILRYWLVYSAEGRPLRVDGLITDITEAHAAEEKIKVQEELLLHQSRRAAMGEMISNIAHQWRQPLNSLRLTLGNLEDAKAFGELTEKAFDENLKQADKLINQMNQTVRDFVTFFRPRKQPEIFNLSSLVDQSLEVMQASFQKLQVHLDVAEAVKVKGYPNEVMQVILVLLQNAREAIQSQENLEGEVWISLQKVAGRAELIVEDNAGGISEEAISQVFDPYFTTKAEGSGIGLYMAKMVIEKQMQGEIQVANSRQGALFTLSFPLTSDPLS